jgi:hypothetical protein
LGSLTVTFEINFISDNEAEEGNQNSFSSLRAHPSGSDHEEEDYNESSSESSSLIPMKMPSLNARRLFRHGLIWIVLFALCGMLILYRTFGDNTRLFNPSTPNLGEPGQKVNMTAFVMSICPDAVACEDTIKEVLKAVSEIVDFRTDVCMPKLTFSRSKH